VGGFLTAASLGLGLVSSFLGGSAKKEQGIYNQYIANFNARVLENDAVRARQAGNQRENDVRRAGAELKSRQKATFGAKGVEVTSGSAAAIQRDTTNLTNIDAMRIRTSVDSQVQSLKNKAKITRSEGAASARAGRSAFTSSLLSGGAQFASGLYTNRSAFGF